MTSHPVDGSRHQHPWPPSVRISGSPLSRLPSRYEVCGQHAVRRKCEPSWPTIRESVQCGPGGLSDEKSEILARRQMMRNLNFKYVHKLVGLAIQLQYYIPYYPSLYPVPVWKDTWLTFMKVCVLTTAWCRGRGKRRGEFLGPPTPIIFWYGIIFCLELDEPMFMIYMVVGKGTGVLHL